MRFVVNHDLVSLSGVLTERLEGMNMYRNQSYKRDIDRGYITSTQIHLRDGLFHYTR